MENLGGRPPYYNTPEELAEKINEYFEYVKGEFHYEDSVNDDGSIDKIKVWDREPEPVSIAGMCFFLGFESRQSFYDNEKREGFSYVIKRARLFVESYYEKTAQNAKTPTFQIFALKNMGWSDKQEIDHTTQGDKMNIISLGNGVKPQE